VNFGPAHFNQLGLNPLRLQFPQNVPKQNGGVPAFAGAAVERNNLYPSFVHELLSPCLPSSRSGGKAFFQTLHYAPYPPRSVQDVAGRLQFDTDSAMRVLQSTHAA
jgi:hypothetical protein